MAKKKISIGKLKDKFQKVFNAYIRARDQYGGYFMCISCGVEKTTDEQDAGHFYAKSGYDGLRFMEINCNSECIKCNRFDESHLIGYAMNLKNVLLEEELKELHQKAKDYKMGTLTNDYYQNGKWNRLALEEGIKIYKEKINEVQ